MKQFLFIILILLSVCSARAQGVYSLNPQPVCWSFNDVDSSLLSLVVFNIRDTIGLFQGYVNAVDGSYVNTTAGGTISAGYCCCEGSGSGSSNVSITDNDDGTYTAIVGTDTTIIYTKADSLYTTQTIAIGDTSYLANSVVQDILIAISQEVNNLRSETGCDLTITQAGHGFAVGDLLTQDPNSGVYADAAADTSLNFPVAYVCSVIDADNFKVDTEGWVSGAHGGTVWRDYFLQDAAGTVDTVPGSFPIFAWRTFSPTLRYYDIPEYISSGSSGGGGSSYAVTASNGLNDQDGSVDVDVELGGTLDKTTIIAGANQTLNINNLNDGFFLANDQVFIAGGNRTDVGDADGLTYVKADYITVHADDTLSIEAITGVVRMWSNDDDVLIYAASSDKQVNLSVNADVSTTNKPEIVISQDSLAMTMYQAAGGGAIGAQIKINNNSRIIYTGVPNYANDAAADADGSLPSGAIYQVTAEDRTLRIKP